MTTFTEGALRFDFDPRCEVSEYDEWAFYRRHFTYVAGGCKAVDFLCIHDDTAWLIEVKDYRVHPRTKPSRICDEVAAKVRDTLAGLAAAQNRATARERSLARQAVTARRWRIALHIEQRAHSVSVPRLPDTANLRLDLKKAVRSVDPHPIVVNAASAVELWTVTSVGGSQ